MMNDENCPKTRRLYCGLSRTVSIREGYRTEYTSQIKNCPVKISHVKNCPWEKTLSANLDCNLVLIALVTILHCIVFCIISTLKALLELGEK